MSTINSTAVSLLDIKSRLDPNGLLARSIDVLNLENQILNDMKWMEGNLPTGNVTTQRTSIPTPGTRRFNEGAAVKKATSKQVTDTCTLLESNSEVDEEVMKLAPNPEMFRVDEDAAHMEGYRQKVASMIFYGDTNTNPSEFNGLNVRFNALSTVKTKPGYQIISAGGSGSVNASAWFIDWSQQGVAGIYPKGSTAGLETRDMGLNRILDANGNPFYAYCTNFKWKPGLAVRNYRKVARVANIDTINIQTFGSGSDTSANLIQKFILAKNRIDAPANVVCYVNELIYSWFEIMLTDKNNVYITRKELADKFPQLYFAGIPIRMCDALLSSEATIS